MWHAIRVVNGKYISLNKAELSEWIQLQTSYITKNMIYINK